MFASEAHIQGMNDAEVESTLRQIMPDLYFVNAPVAQRRRHLQLLAQLAHEPLILDFQARPGIPLTELTICAYDESEPGLLSKVCGTLAALQINIQTAFIYTLPAPRTPVPATEGAIAEASETGIVAATFPTTNRWIAVLLISEPYLGRARALSKANVQKVRDELVPVMQGYSTVAQLLTRNRRRPYPPLYIYDLTATPSGTPGLTVLTLQAEDYPGVLYRTTAGLAALGLNIVVAQINTADSKVDDIFFFTKAHGQPLPESELPTITSQLRAILQAASAPSGES